MPRNPIIPTLQPGVGGGGLFVNSHLANQQANITGPWVRIPNEVEKVGIHIWNPADEYPINANIEFHLAEAYLNPQPGDAYSAAYCQEITDPDSLAGNNRASSVNNPEGRKWFEFIVPAANDINFMRAKVTNWTAGGISLDFTGIRGPKPKYRFGNIFEDKQANDDGRWIQVERNVRRVNFIVGPYRPGPLYGGGVLGFFWKAFNYPADAEYGRMPLYVRDLRSGDSGVTVPLANEINYDGTVNVLNYLSFMWDVPIGYQQVSFKVYLRNYSQGKFTVRYSWYSGQ